MYTSHTAVHGSSALSAFLLSLITLDERNVSDRFGRMASDAYGSDPDEVGDDEVTDEDEVPGNGLGEDERDEEEGDGEEMSMDEGDNPEEGEEDEDEKEDPLADDF